MFYVTVLMSNFVLNVASIRSGCSKHQHRLQRNNTMQMIFVTIHVIIGKTCYMLQNFCLVRPVPWTDYYDQRRS